MHIWGPRCFFIFDVFKTVVCSSAKTSVLSYILGEVRVQRQIYLKDQTFCFLSHLNSFVLNLKLLISNEVSASPLSWVLLYSPL